MKFKQILASRNLQNSIWNIIEVLLGPAILFVSIPIFLAQLGAEDYGIWMLVNSIIVIMQVFNLGLNFSTYKHVSVAISEKNNQQISNTLNTNLSFTALILLVTLVAASFLCLGIYYKNLFVENQEIKITLIISIFIGMGILFGKLTEQILYNVYRAFENFKYVTILSIVLKLITVLGNIIIAFLTKNVVYILMFTALISIIGIAINYRFIFRFVPEYRFQFVLNQKLIKHEIKYSLFIWLQSIAVIIVYQGDRMLVSYKFGLIALSFYAIIATLFNHIHMIFGAISSWLFPQVAKNKENETLVYDLYIKVRNVSLVISIVLLACFSLLAQPLFTVWLGEENYLQVAHYVKWFTVFEFFLLFSTIPNLFLNAAGHEKFNLRLVTIYTGINLVGLLLGLFIFNSLYAMLIGLGVSIIPGMYWLYYSISIKFDKQNHKSIGLALLFLPSIFGSGIAIFDNFLIKTGCFILCLVSVYLIYIKQQKTDFKIMAE